MSKEIKLISTFERKQFNWRDYKHGIPMAVACFLSGHTFERGQL